MANNIKAKADLEAFRQHWDEARHNDTTAVAFTNFFWLVIVIGVFAMISMRDDISMPLSMYQWFGILAGVSLLGLLICLRINYASKQHRDYAKDCAKELTGLTDENALKKYIPLLPNKGPSSKLPSVRLLFVFFYFASTVFFGLLAAGVIKSP